MEAKRFAGEAKRTYYYIIGYSYRDAVFAFYVVAVLGAALAAGMAWP
ncbi:hypothetical protein [Cohnella cholangitidis]